jgi:hypothetical protein
MDTVRALYPNADPSQFFTSDLNEFSRSLGQVEVAGDEATLIALDIALDYPWRSKRSCHRVVICLTDEPFETGTDCNVQLCQLQALQMKIQQLGVMLFLVAPESAAFAQLAMVDKSEYETVDSTGDGLRKVPFDKVLAYMGKSVSVSVSGYQGTADTDASVRRALYGQDRWITINKQVRGR